MKYFLIKQAGSKRENHQVVSTHVSLERAQKAQAKFAETTTNMMGGTMRIPTVVVCATTKKLALVLAKITSEERWE